MWRIQFCIFGRPNARTVAELVTYPPVPRVPSPHLEFDLSLSAASRSPPSARPLTSLLLHTIGRLEM
jgi:hypothetical protein